MKLSKARRVVKLVQKIDETKYSIYCIKHDLKHRVHNKEMRQDFNSDLRTTQTKLKRLRARLERMK